MRFPSKKAFVRASLVLIFAIPTWAHAEDAKAKYLNVDEAKTAFGAEFSLEKDGDYFTLYGGTTKSCRDLYEIASDANAGTFSIHFKGGDKACLSKDEALKSVDASKNPFVTLFKDNMDAKMKPTGNFDHVDLVVKEEYSSKSTGTPFELKNDKGESLQSPAYLADKKKKDDEDKKKEAERKKDQAIDRDVMLVTKCGRGLKELQVGSDALDRLMGLSETVKAGILADQGDKFFTDAEKNLREKFFRACRVKILKARTDDLYADSKLSLSKKDDGITAEDCDSRLKKIGDEDESYIPKIADAYLELVNRYMNSSTLSVEDAYTAAMDAIAKVREFAPSDEDKAEALEKKLDAAERNLNLALLRKAAMQGADSEDFKAMKDHVLGYMTEEGNGCITDQGAIVATRRLDPKCGESQWIALQYAQQLQLAQTSQVALNQQAQLAMCNNATANGLVLTPAEQTACTTIQAAAKAKEAANANAGLTGANDGFGFGTTGAAATQTTNPANNTTAANTTVANNTTNGNGVVNNPTNNGTNVPVNNAGTGVRHLYK
ncbi:MAG: hypothetical protein JST04_14655 [Bdellovibrionales bacterium]|nr:hypothetical protein [Bdellovibrionales bacterium]